MKNLVTRRTAITTGLAAGAASCAKTPVMTAYVSPADAQGGAFSHGVASGDPGPDSVVIWTRATPGDNAGAMRLVWEAAEDEAFTAMVAKGEAETGPARDYTAKVLLRDLEPGRTYYYRFRAGDVYSQVGRTRTLPTGGVDAARFAIISCSNYPFGYFNVYDLISRRDDIDAVLHLGDYIYEYGREGYGGQTGARLGREHEPAHEIITLGDYRERYSQYRADAASQAMHARHALIPIWDDHETSNDSWKDGAENHQPETEGEWNARRRAALQAYYEWMPVREPSMQPEAFFRAYSFGDLLTITAIETRLMARSRQFEYKDLIATLQTSEDVERFRSEILQDPAREMLGAAQLDFLGRAVERSVTSGQPWRLIANQVIMADVVSPDLTEYVTEEEIQELQKQWSQARAFVQYSKLGLPANLDAWDGYPAARERFYERMRAAGEDGMIVVTGDTHTWWANDLKNNAGEQLGVELGVNSVTSPSPYRPQILGGKGREYSLLTNRKNKSVRYLSGEHHGYIDLRVERDKAHAEYIAVDTVETRNYNAFTKVSFDIKKTRKGVKYSDADGLSFKEGFLF